MKLVTYFPNPQAQPIKGPWRQYDITDSLIYSHRSTEYDRASYPSSLHFHDYYELLVFVEGDVRYICESSSALPRFGDVIIIPPGKLHMSLINSDHTRYERYVFYLYPEAFDSVGGRPLLHFMEQDRGDQFTFSLKRKHMDELLPVLGQLDSILTRGTPKDHALAIAYTLQAFYLLDNLSASDTAGDPYLPQNVIDIQHYLDEHFTEVATVSNVAEHFFYSREYVSRLFKRYLNTSVADYVANRRVSYCQKLIISSNLPLIDICYRAGFGSVSAFIRMFQRITGMTPSQYRRINKTS